MSVKEGKSRAFDIFDERRSSWTREGSLELSPRDRALLSNRLMLQAPADLTVKQVANVARDLNRRVRGLPDGAFMALTALGLLADQGNKLADLMFRAESEKLGLTEPFRVLIKRGS